MHSQARKQTHFLAAAVCSLLFLLLFSLIPGVKASAENKYYTSPFLGTTISYYNANVVSFSNTENVTITCTNRGSFTIKVKPNTSETSRTIKLSANKSGGTAVDTLYITQYGVPTKKLSIGCAGGNLAFTASGAYSYTYSNTAVCSSRSGSNFVVKPNTSTSARSCKVTVKNSSGNIIYYVYINQSGVPTKTITAGCTGGNYSFTATNASSYTYSNTAVCNSRSGSSFVVKPNTSTSSRSCKVTVKNSAGNAIYYVTINQSGVPTQSLTASYTGGNLAFTASGASSYAYSNTAVCNSRSGNYFVVTPNTTTSKRSCKVTVKNSAGNIIYYVNINQDNVPSKNVNKVEGRETTFSYYNASAAFFDRKNTSMITNITATNMGSFTFSVSSNPSTTTTRSSAILVKNSAKACIDVILVEQANRPLVTKNETYNADPRSVTFTCPGTVNRITYSNSAMVKKRTALGSGKYQFDLTQNTATTSRTNKVTFYDKSGNSLAIYTITQQGVPFLKVTLTKGIAQTLSYSNERQIASFDCDKSYVSQITATNPNQFKLSITANPSVTADRTFTIISKTGSGAYAEIIRITQSPHSHEYTYSSSAGSNGRILTRKCKHCDDGDKDISYQEYLKYFSNLEDCEISVKSYMNALGYGVNSAESKNMVKVYQYLHKNNNKNWNTASSSVQKGLQDLKSVADAVAIFANNDKLNNGLTVISAANNAYMFFTAKDAAGKFSSAVKLAGDFIGAGLDTFSGGYLSSALSTVGDALKKTIPIAFEYKEKEFIDALIAFDQVETDSVLSNMTFAQVCDNYKDIQGTIKNFFNKKYSKYSNTCIQKVKEWKAAYEEQVAMNKIYAVLGKTSGVPTSDFWAFVDYYTK